MAVRITNDIDKLKHRQRTSKFHLFLLNLPTCLYFYLLNMATLKLWIPDMLCTDSGGPWSEDREEREKGWDSEHNGGIGVRRSRDISHCARRENNTPQIHVSL